MESTLLDSLAPKNPDAGWKQRVTAYGLILVFEDYIVRRTSVFLHEDLEEHFAIRVYYIFWTIFAPRLFGFAFIGLELEKKHNFREATDVVKENWKIQNSNLSKRIGPCPKI